MVLRGVVAAFIGNHRAVAIDLEAVDRSTEVDVRAAMIAGTPRMVPSIGVATTRLGPLACEFARTLTTSLVVDDQGRWGVPVGDPHEALAEIEQAVIEAPRAAGVLADTLRLVAGRDPVQGVVVESLAYSTLLGGREFRRWRAATAVRERPPSEGAVRIERRGDVLHVTLSRRETRNALDQAARQALAEALDVALADPSLHVVLSGQGPSFCSGGDLDEFGTATDLAEAHEIRAVHGPAIRMAKLGERTTARVHGACVGAGVELPAFAGRVVAPAGTTFRLPEVRMGLIPGAGGTASVTRRIGRWRSAWLALSGATIDVERAIAWGLVDELAADECP